MGCLFYLSNPQIAMQYTNLIWRDGQPYSELFDDVYYSSAVASGSESNDIFGEAEFQHVFFKHNGLPERWQERHDFVITELGFGSGLNCILTMREWLKHCAECNEEKTLHYIAIEKHPFSAASIAELLSPYPQLKSFCDELLENYPPAIEATHSRSLFNNRVRIHFKFMDVCDALKNHRLTADAWYLDGFSPAKNPYMWSQRVFELIAYNSRDGATCSTYTCAGWVKRNMQKAGFAVNKAPGFGKKREMLVAKFNAAEKSIALANTMAASFKYSDKPWFEPPPLKSVAIKNATIIGAGVAGLSLAYALVQRGWAVTVVDHQSTTTKQASTNPAAIIYPRLSINNDIDTEFFTAAYCYALYVYKLLQKKSQQPFWFDVGLLQLMDEKRITQIINKFQFNADFISLVGQSSDAMLADKAGQVTANYASAGIVLPAILLDVLKNECGNKLTLIDAKVTALNYDDKKWQCLHHVQLISEAEVLIIANGTGVNDLSLSLRFPVEAIRGQVIELNENKQSQKIKKIFNADVHITPAIKTKHYLGASYTRNGEMLGICQTENRKLLDSLDKMYPGIFKDEDCCKTWVGFRTISKDRVPIVGAVPDEVFFNHEYADIAHGSTIKTYQPGRYLNGLYISAAHGSRGFTSGFISAEIIASQIAGEPSPINKKILDYLSPSRFIVNKLKRR